MEKLIGFTGIACKANKLLKTHFDVIYYRRVIIWLCLIDNLLYKGWEYQVGGWLRWQVDIPPRKFRRLA